MIAEPQLLELETHLPANLANEILDVLKNKNVQLTITKKRSTKLGDYRRPNSKVKYHRISVNGSLNKYSFLITLVHELAHLEVFENFKSNILPHGIEWKNTFGQMLGNLLVRNIFPDDISKELANYAQNPKASSVSDVGNQPILNDLPGQAVFQIGKKIFQKGQKRRTRFLCKELTTNKMYVVSGLAEIKLLDSINNISVI
jgi:hypothetical protein